MNSRDQFHREPGPPLRYSAEELGRLSKFLARLGFGSLTVHERQVSLRNLVDGLGYLAHRESGGWIHALTQIDLAEFEEAAATATQGALLQVLIGQPAPTRPSSARKQCIALASMAIIQSAVEPSLLPGGFAHMLKQLFRSGAEGWMDFCSCNLLDAVALQAWVPRASHPAVIVEFHRFLTRLVPMGLPAITSLLKPEKSSPADAEPAEAAADAPQEDGPEPKAPKYFADATPKFNLFENQNQLNTQQDIVDGYRLSPHWGRLTPLELLRSLKLLNTDLMARPAGEYGWRLSVHAAARYVSLFAGLSLKKCWSLPLNRKGSMRLSIGQGVIRRDMLVIAPRTDRDDRRRVHGRWWRTRLPVEVTSALQQLLARHPSCRSLGELLEATGLTYDNCQEILNKDWPTSHRPEDARFSQSLRPCLLALDIHPAIVARFTGDTMTTPASDHYYLSLLESQVHQALQAFCEWAGLTAPPPPVRDRRIGTPRAVTPDGFQNAMQRLNQMVLHERSKLTSKASVEEILRFHNLYTTAVAIQIVCGLGGRGDRVESLTFERVFASDHYIVLSDRRVDRYSAQRVCPSTQTLTATRRAYIQHLRAVSDSLLRACTKSAEFVLKVASGYRPHAPAFRLYDQTGAGWESRPLKRQDLVELARNLGFVDLNAARHYWFAALVDRGVAQVAIDALLGHHIPGAEPFGFGSGISVRQICDYLRPILNDIQAGLDFAPLEGRGQHAARYQSLPQMTVEAKLQPLPNLLLQQKLEVQDFLVKELSIYAQDPPSGPQTLVAHANLSRLRDDFVGTAKRRDTPFGALLFALIAFDLVLTQSEQQALLDAAVGDGVWQVQELTILEAEDPAGRPVVQRLASDHTLAALHAVANSNSRVSLRASFERAVGELHMLVTALDPNWKASAPKKTLELLSIMASHWAAIEVSPGTLFGVLHKAPFIPAHDLARIRWGRARVFGASSEPERKTRRRSSGDFEFQKVWEIVGYWGNPDTQLGDDHARRKGCSSGLLARRAQPAADEFECALIDLILADLSKNAPYRTLKPTTLPEYVRGYDLYFGVAREEGTLELDPDVIAEAYAAMGGSKDISISELPRWQMLHICAFLASRGLAAPAGFLSGRATKVPRPPRHPVYVSRAECAVAKTMIAEVLAGQGGTYEFAATRLALLREMPMRISEPRYASLLDFDPGAALLHVTSTGHSHLKSPHSRGTLPLSKELCREMTDLWLRKRNIAPKVTSNLFADSHLVDAHYSAFDTISDVTRDTLIMLTGCRHFRQHDLRSAAVSDLAFAVEETLARLCEGRAPANQLTGADVTRLHVRFALASRLARHASVLTTLRYYVASGMLNLRDELDAAAAHSDPSGAYVASLLAVDAQTLYARANRARAASGTVSGRPPANWGEFLSVARAARPWPILGSALSEHPSHASLPPDIDSAHIAQAVLLHLCGTPLTDAADACQVERSRVAQTMKAVDDRASELGVKLVWDDSRSPLLSSPKSNSNGSLPELVRRYARWTRGNSNPTGGSREALLNAIGAKRNCLTVRTKNQFLALIPVLASLRQIGFEIVVRMGAHFGLRDLDCIPTLDAAGLLRQPQNSSEPVFATVSFLAQERQATKSHRTTANAQAPFDLARVSPRSFGRAGRLVIAGLLLTLTRTDFMEVKR